MNLERYDFLVHESKQDYTFISRGPNGKVKKMVRFNLCNDIGITYTSLTFGDWDGRRNRIDHFAVTNNTDTRKVLATVSNIVLTFANFFPDLAIHAKGSTPSRTRLYQMGILAYYQEIEPVFNIYGFKDNEWHTFRKGVNYEAFVVKRK